MRELPLHEQLAAPDYFEVAGFKSIRKLARVQLGKLTILAGANSSGKSAVMQPILLLKQTLESHFDPGPLLLSGAHVAFTSPNEILSRGGRRKDDVRQFSVTLGPTANHLTLSSFYMRRPASAKTPATRLVFRQRNIRHPEKGFGLPLVSVRCDGRWIDIQKNMKPADYCAVVNAYWDIKGEQCQEAAQEGTIDVVYDRFLPFARVRYFRGRRESESFLMRRRVAPPLQPLLYYVPWVLSLLHLPGLRGHRERLYPVAGIEQGAGERVIAQGPFTPYVASLLDQWSNQQSRGEEKLAQVNDWMRHLGLAGMVRAIRVNAAQVKLQVARLPARRKGRFSDLVDLADVGFGVSQVLPVVVALVAAIAEQPVYIEQPELHLHPRAQHRLGEILCNAAASGARVIVETHSGLVLRAVQTAVAKGLLDPAEVSLNWFGRDARSGVTRIRRADIQGDGTFGDWPVDFADVEAKADAAWLDVLARQRRR